MRLLRISAPHFVAGLEVDLRDGRAVVTRTAPILAWALGKDAVSLAPYFRRKQWSVEVL